MQTASQEPANEASAEVEAHTAQHVRLPTEQLVAALNEHVRSKYYLPDPLARLRMYPSSAVLTGVALKRLWVALPQLQLTERRKGNEHYRARRFPEALHHYDRARSIVEYVKGSSTGDQHELDANRVAVYLNIAAVCIASQDASGAVHWCSQALELEPRNVKGLLRRSKANLQRHEYEVSTTASVSVADFCQISPKTCWATLLAHMQCHSCRVQVCLADLKLVQQLDPLSTEAAEMMPKVERSWAKAQKADKALCADMLAPK